MKLQRSKIAKNLLLSRTCKSCVGGPRYSGRCPCVRVIAVNKNTARIAYPPEDSCEQWELRE